MSVSKLILSSLRRYIACATVCIYIQYICNANDADQYKKWLGEDTPILPRKFRILEIRGEPGEKKTIRSNMAIERVRGEIRLLRMRAEKSQENIFNTAEEMNKVLKYKASGRILEILENLWKLDCEREEKRSRDRWRKKETWQLHYVRKYGNNIVKKKKESTNTEN